MTHTNWRMLDLSTMSLMSPNDKFINPLLLMERADTTSLYNAVTAQSWRYI